MLNNHPLDKLICKLEKSDASIRRRSNVSSEVVVIIDKQKNEILPKVTLLDVFREQNILYYLVRNTNDALNVAERKDLRIDVTDFAIDLKLSMSLAYRASCPPGNEMQVVKALCSDDSPGNELDRIIKRCVARLTDGKATRFVDNYSSQVERLQSELKERVEREVFLKLDFRISLDEDNKKQLEPIKIGPTEITVYVSDSDDPLDLKLQTELIIDDPIKASSNITSGWLISLVKLTKQEITKYLLKKTTINQFYYELKDTVRNNLVQHLDRVLYQKGLRVGYLFLDSKVISSSSVPKELVEIQHTVNCKVQKYGNLVAVENTLQMLPQDVRRYISAQSPNLKAWVENKLERIVKPILLDKKYVDILLDFQKESQAIKQAMQFEAESIGYIVKHIVSLPKLNHLVLKENLEIEDKDNSKIEFSTNVASIKVKLSTTANIKFEDFTKLEDYLVKTDDENQLVSRPVHEIKEIIREAINSKTREILRTIEPERFYMSFYESETGKKSVEQELKDAVKKVLEERFGATVIRVVPIPEQTDIIDYLQRLMGIVGSFECAVPSLSGGEPVKFHGDFKILGIERGSWNIFQSAFQSMRESQQQLIQELDALKYEYSEVLSSGDVEDNREEIDQISQRIRTIENEIFGIDDIRNSIEKSVNAKLMIADSQLLRYTDMKLLSTMERFINQWAKESVIDQYGLEISIRNLYRTRTKQEEYLFEAQQQLELAKVDEAQAQVEARKQQRLIQQEMSSRKNQAQSAELNKLYEQREKLIADVDTDTEELEYLNDQIARLEREVLGTSLEDAESKLNILEPKKNKDSSAIAFEEQMSLSSNSKNYNSENYDSNYSNGENNFN